MSFKSPSDIRVTSRQIPSWFGIPNTSIQNKPLLIYHDAFDATPSELTKQLEGVGEVVPQWVYGMYGHTHFHTTTHEVLGVVSGRAQLGFGGEGNPERFEPTVNRGDMIIVPAGVGHKLKNDLDAGEEHFKMLGAYPPQKHWDMCYGREGEEEKVKSIANLDWFRQDPLFGTDGPALHV